MVTAPDEVWDAYIAVRYFHDTCAPYLIFVDVGSSNLRKVAYQVVPPL